MHCYLCRSEIEDGQFFYNDHGVQVCKPCFLESERCFVCRFPGRKLRQVEGLGLECEFCRDTLIGEGSDVEEIVKPAFAYLAQFGHRPIERLRFVFTDRTGLREMQVSAGVPPEQFIDDFLRYAYPVFYREGQFHLLRRMSRPTFVVYAIVQFAAAGIARRYELPHLLGATPFHTLARGWCHWLGFEAAKRLGYDLERRQLRKWPELGLQGEFERWQKMSRFNKPREMLAFLVPNLNALARKHLVRDQPAPPEPEREHA